MPRHPCVTPLAAPQVGATRTDDPAEEQAQKRLKSLLNKITKDNFAKITGQVRRLHWGRDRGCNAWYRTAVAGWHVPASCRHADSASAVLTPPQPPLRGPFAPPVDY